MVRVGVRRVAALVLAGLVFGVLGSAGVVPAAYGEGQDTKIMLVLDASGSMNGKDPSGGTKLEAAKKALSATVNELPDDAQVGLRVYGATVASGPKACTDSQLVQPVGRVDKGALTNSINGFKAQGETPIAFSVGEAVKDLGAGEKRHIILVSDGEETCAADPCAEIKKVLGSGVSLQIDTVGFGVNDKARKQLQCIADVGNGTYYDAKDAASLGTSLRRLGKRALRPFTVKGTPVVGTASAAGAPTLTVGQYTDRTRGSTQGEVARYYKVKRTQSGSTMRVSVVGRLPNVGMLESLDLGSWEFSLVAGKAECSKVGYYGGRSSGVPPTVNGTVVAFPLDPLVAEPKDEETKTCANADEFTFKILRRAGTAGEIPVEIRVIEEPALKDAANLPAGVNTVPKGSLSIDKSPAKGTPVEVVGGASFNDAPEVKPGTYLTQVLPGEVLYFKTPIAYGQNAIFAMDGPVPESPAYANLAAFQYQTVNGDVYAPDFSEISSDPGSATYAPEKGNKLLLTGKPKIQQVPEVQYRNRWDSPAMSNSKSRGFAMAGYYYYAVSMGANKELDGVPISLRFSLAVNGAAHDAPASEPLPTPPTTEPLPTPPATEPPANNNIAEPPTAQRGNGSPVTWLVVGGGGLVILGGASGLGYWIWRRH